MEKRSIHLLQVSERPRERLQLNGVAALSDEELIAILLGSGTSKIPVLSLAELLLNKAEGLIKLSGYSFERLCKIKGIGPAKATTLLAAAEMGRRAFLPEKNKIYIHNDDDAVRHFAHLFRDVKSLQYIVVLLSRERELLASYEIKVLDGFPDLQQVLSIVMEAGAHGFGLMRNATQQENKYLLAEQVWLENLRAASSMHRIRFYSRLIVPT